MWSSGSIENQKSAIENSPPFGCGIAALQIVFADRMKNVESFDDVLQRDDVMFHSAGDAIHVAGAKNTVFVADEEMSLAFQDDANLLMRVRVRLHHRVRLERHQAEHH